MELALSIFFGILIFSFVAQAFLAVGFVWKLGRYQVPLVDDQHSPSAAIVLCLRGGDPFLVRCLEGLFDQDYPNYRILVVLDHPKDPAAAILNGFIKDRNLSNLEVIALDPDRTDRCSLKCASLLQALDVLVDRVEFLAQLDADTIPHRTWLRELATGLAPDNVGAATGNRWYMPEVKTAGSMIRYVWNAAAVVQMYWYGIAWGGSIAVKCSAIREADLKSHWGRSLCEDTMLFAKLRTIGKKVAFVPSLMMINHESCDIKGFFPWVRRQLLTARLYHPSWLAVVGHGISSALWLILGWGGALVFLVLGRWYEGCLLAFAMFVFQVALTILLLPMELGVRRIVRSRGEPDQWLSFLEALLWFPIVFATQWVYTRALVSSLSIREVDWRGIDYRIDGPWEIHRMAYRPYIEVQQQNELDELHSL